MAPQVHNAFYSFVAPTPTGTQPETVVFSADVARMVGLDPAECERPEFAAVFSGNAPLPGGPRPFAQCYGGHQFGMVRPQFFPPAEMLMGNFRLHAPRRQVLCCRPTLEWCL